MMTPSPQPSVTQGTVAPPPRGRGLKPLPPPFYARSLICASLVMAKADGRAVTRTALGNSEGEVLNMWMTGGRSNKGWHHGVAGPWVVVALVALLGAAALVIDIGRLVVAAQRAQDMADSAALAGGCKLPSAQEARDATADTILANNSEGTGFQVQCDASDITCYGSSEEVPGYGTLGPWAQAICVSTHVPVEYSFARIVGVEGGTATRSATVIRAPVGGLPICTMWIAEGTSLTGDSQQLLMADGPHYAGVPGSFGFLQPPTGCTASFFDLLQGYNLTSPQIEDSFVGIGDTVYAETGEMVGQWKRALKQDQGRSRLEQGTSGKWASDTFTDYHNDNPRIMLIPLVSFIGGTGSNASFKIEKFGAFWLEDVNQGQKEIWGRFIQYDFPGGDPNGTAINEGSVFATALVR